MKRGPQAIDYAVMPLEGLWWADDMSTFVSGDKSRWKWTMTILQPDFVEAAVVEQALQDVKRKKALPAVEALPPSSGSLISSGNGPRSPENTTRST